ncbi:MAG: Hpt domain-containing protein, partial [Gammaproteobacteria bacterium]|nr:Hpt domain-containing protein [Gammaproteobacteria bacterium]
MSAVSGLNYRSRVIDELIRVLAAVQDNIALFVGNADNRELLPELRERVAEISDTLKLIELHGAALLSGELDKLLQAFADQRTRSQDDATVILVRASQQLPEYLTYVKNGSADIPLALLPLLNDMRAVRGSSLLSEAVMLLPDFANARHLQPGSLEKDEERRFRSAIKHARTPLMQSLLKWYRGVDVEQSLANIASVFDDLYQDSKGTDLSRLWRVARAVVESLLDGGLEPNASIKLLFGQIERLLQKLMAMKSKAIYQSTPTEIFKNLLYYIALSTSQSKKVRQIQSFYQLHELLPSQGNRDQALHALDGPGIKMLEAAGEGVREELAQVKTAIEIFAHADEPEPESLASLPERLAKLSSTLQMLGMHKVADLNDELLGKIKKFYKHAASDKAGLLEIAAETLRIENALDEYIHAREQLPHATGQGDFPTKDEEHLLGNQQIDELLVSLLRESMRSLERVKEAYQKILDGLPADSQFSLISDLLKETSGALQILPMPELALLLNGLAGYAESLSTEKKLALSAAAKRNFADVISNIEVYMELHIQRQPVMADLLTRSADALDLLLQDTAQPAPVPEDKEDDEASQTIKIQPVESDIVGEAPSGGSEMLDIFIKEAMQQFNAIGEAMSRLQTDNQDRKALERIRRAYHTLKGSGRMVGASSVSEFAWANENLLNRVISGSVPLDGRILDHLRESIAALPQLVDQLHGASEQVEGMEELKARAFLLAESDDHAEPGLSENKPTLADLEAKEKSAAPGSLVTAVGSADVEESSAGAAESDAFDELDLTDADEPVLELTQTLDVTGVVESSDTLQLPSMEQADTIEMGSAAGRRPEHLYSPIEEAEAPRLKKVAHEDGRPDREQPPERQKTAGFDPVLFEIFSNECAQHIATLKTIIDKALSGDGKVEPSDKMVRAFHTLTGSAQTARVETVASLLAPAEAAVKRKQRAGGRFSRGETLYLGEVVRALEMRLDALRSAAAEPDFVADVESRLESFAERVVAETEDITRTPKLGELQSVFLEEAQDITENLQHLMTRWKAHSADRELARELQSSLHTLKGSARVASYAGIADLAHAMEDAVQRWMDTSAPIEADAFDALEDAIEAIGVNLEQALSGDTPGYFDWLINELRSVRSDVRLVAAGEQTAMLEAETTDETGVETVAINRADVVLPDEPDLESTGEFLTGRLRVDPAIIERLSDLGNESGVHHAHLAQYHGGLAESLGELDQTVTRLRQQLRELDIESDLHINAEGGKRETPGFDPLELDKYGRLQEISRSILESFSDLDDIRYSIGVNLRQAEIELGEQMRLTMLVQETLGQVQMVRFSSVVSRLQKTVENAAASCGKSVRLTVEGGGNVIDRGILKHIVSPLEHLLRNAVAHGIEAATERKESAKPGTGRVDVRLQIDDGDIQITVADDGAGVDLQKIRQIALDKKLIDKDMMLSDQTALALLLKPGFSTAEQLDQIAGRGVGLDAARRDLLRVGGSLVMHSEAGKGTTFQIRIPQSQFVNQVLTLAVADRVFAIPASRVNGVNRISKAEQEALAADPDLRIDFAGHACRRLSLAELLDLPESKPGSAAHSLVFVSIGKEILAIEVDHVPGHLETIVKGVGQQVAALGGYSGACVQSDGRVIPVLDLGALLAETRIPA